MRIGPYLAPDLPNESCADPRLGPDFPFRDTQHDCGSIEKGLPPVRSPKGKSDLWQDVYNTTVLLPSAYDIRVLRQTCMQDIVKLEDELRRAQARDALDDLRTAIIGREAYKIHKKHVAGKKHTSRATFNIRNMEDDVREAANRYRRLRIGLLALGMEESDDTFRLLRKSDVAKYTLDAQQKTLGESSQGNPWIWEHFTYAAADGDAQYQSFYDDGGYQLII